MKKLSLPSLAEYFAQQDYIGHFGWLCGYSADAAFLNDAANRFTLQTPAQRAHAGRIHLAMMLDPGNPPISLVDSPGVAHLPIKSPENKPFELLHAKVALLGFRHQNDASRWKLRLIVSTGNWTRQTLEESLDLAWRIDLSSDHLMKINDDDVRQCCADIKAAQDLLTWVGKQFDLRLLEKAGETNEASKQMSEWVAQCANKAGRAKPRFFDNRKKSLLKQLPDLIKQHCADTARNYLAMGSGFYESATNGSLVPSVPSNIASALRSEKLLTARPELDLFVNPEACQAVADSVQALNDKGFTVRPATTPSSVFDENSQRTLHAKFLFSCREKSNNCNSAWLYLGSGNLTKQGFANPMSAGGGNLEAGVVFAPRSLVRKSLIGTEPASVVTNVLPIQWETCITPEDKTIQAGSAMAERDEQFVAGPVAWLTWSNHGDDNGGILQPPPDVATAFEVLFSNNQPCERNEQGFIWPSPRQREAMVRWETDNGQIQRRFVPVIDEFGRIAATELPKLDMDAAWWQLADFPLPPEDEELNDGEMSNEDVSTSSDKEPHTSASVTYPVRQMMVFIENIAAKQTQVCEADWMVWCSRLEQTLNQMKDSAVIEFFRNNLKLNPLSPLVAAPFRPCFAETVQTDHGKHYEEALQRVANAWSVNDLAAIGGEQ